MEKKIEIKQVGDHVEMSLFGDITSFEVIGMLKFHLDIYTSDLKKRVRKPINRSGLDSSVINNPNPAPGNTGVENK